MEQDDRKLFVLDTNVLLHEPLAIYSFKEHDVVVPMTVLEELDQIKDRKRDVSRDARVAIRALEDILGGKTTPEEIVQGVQLPRREDHGDACGTLSIFPDHQLEMTLASLPADNNDNRIINTALHLQKINQPRSVVLVTKDINMRLKAKGSGLENVEDYRKDRVIDDIDLMSKGYEVVEGDFWGQVESVKSVQKGRVTMHVIDRRVLPDAYPQMFVYDEGDFVGLVRQVNQKSPKSF